MSKINENFYLKRYLPDCRMFGAFAEQTQTKIVKDDFGESITDKESYRLSLVNGIGASDSGALNPACYMFPEGKYDINKDISYILRPDLSPVQIDDYLHAMEDSLNSATDDLKIKIEKDIQYAKEMKSRSEKTDSSEASE